MSVLRRLYLYSALQNFANSLYSPFVGFVAASTGVPPLLLGVVSSAGTVFNNISAFLVSFRRWRPLKLILFANAASAVALVLMAAFAEVHAAYTAMYAVVTASLGISGYGWSLIMEQYSRERRGISLAEFSFYSTLGGLVATLITGFLIRDDPLAIRLALYAAAALTAANTAQLYKLGIDYSEGPRAPRGGVGRRLLKFYAENFVFMATWSFAWPLFPLAQVYVFHMTGLQVAIVQIITVASNLAFQRAMGRFVDRHMRLSLFLGRATFMIWPLVYGVATNVYQIYAAYLFFGFGGSISNIAYFAYVVDNAEDKRRAIGYFNLVNALGAAAGAELSSAVLAYMGNYNEELIRRMLVGTAFARLGSSLLFLL
ncbi:MAG: MFS transporter [Thermoproteus sp.]